ncbi:MAG TPA: threonine/serine dehydratase [Gemmatimonadales bacterium]|nr:threonine/serine dehydratase [Gemmatimonadales bacterium]
MGETVKAHSLDDIRAAAASLHAVVPPTPLVETADLSRRVGQPVFLKCELWQPMGAFKVRGAWTAISRLSKDAQQRGIITHSSGNHGQAVAYVSQRLGLRAVIVMPKTAPAVKVEGVKRYGGEIVFTEAVSSARLQKAAEQAAEQGLTMVPPYDDSDIVLGQSTASYEVLGDHPEISTFLVPIGGGGLLAGTSVTTSHMKPDARVVGVEPDGAPKLSAALAAGHPVALEKCTSLADGLLPLSVGTLTFEYMKPMVHEAVRVTDDEIGAAVKYLWETQGLRVEPSGAVSVAALLTGKLKPTSPTAVMLTGGNVDPALFQRLVA